MSVPVAYVAVVLIWSTTPLAVKWSGEGVGFLWGVLGRMSIAATLCVLLIFALRLSLPWHRDARRAYASGAVGAYGGMLSVYWAAQYVPSGLIAVLFGLSPLFTALAAHWLLGERALTPARLLGMGLGIAGLTTVFGVSSNLGEHATAGLFGVLLAVALHSLSLVLVKRHSGSLPSLTVTGGALVLVTPLFLITWLALDGHSPAEPTARAVASIIYLGVIGSVLGFTLFFYVLRRVSANTAALITLITPILALLLGSAINHEVVTARIWAGTMLVLAGLALHQWGWLLERFFTLRSKPQ
jgi:drug/metabolite transporter (DMT)-like permease